MDLAVKLVMEILGKIKEKRGNSQAGVILIRGLEDLPESASKVMGDLFQMEVFNPQWKTKESLKEKAGRLDKMVQQIRDEGKQPIVIGLSAGAAMMTAYMVMYPNKIRYGYSVSGLLDPNLNKMDLSHLTETSSGFRETAEFLTDNLRPEIIKELKLADKISAYSSPYDQVVPQAASHPEWIKNFQEIKIGDHLGSIILVLVGDIGKQIEKWNEAKLE